MEIKNSMWLKPLLAGFVLIVSWLKPTVKLLNSLNFNMISAQLPSALADG